MRVFIVNPVAGGGYALKAEEALRAALNRRMEPCVFLRTESPGHAEVLASQAALSGADAVISVGGDGTSLEVARGLIGKKAVLGIIPAGTGNDLIKTLGIPRDLNKALEVALNGKARAVDAAKVNNRLFLNVAGVGFDVRVLDETERFKKHMRGLLPYLCGLVCAIAHHKPVHVRVITDGEEKELDALICAVANGRYIGGGIPICPDASVEDGLLDVVLLRDSPRWKLPPYLPGLMGKRILKFGITTRVKAKKVEIFCPGARVQVDGEIAPMDHVVFEVLPGALRVCMPE